MKNKLWRKVIALKMVSLNAYLANIVVVQVEKIVNSY